MFTRRTATVTMSAPEASCACAITACDEYLPVPTISRDVNVRPAMTNGVSVNSQLPTPNSQPLPTPNHQSVINNQQPIAQSKIGNQKCCLPASNEVHDLEPVAFADDDLGIGLALDDGQIVLDGDAARIDFQPGQQTSHRDRLVQLVAFAVESDDHEIPNLLREIRVSQGKP